MNLNISIIQEFYNENIMKSNTLLFVAIFHKNNNIIMIVQN